MGPIKEFNVKCFVDAALELLRSDETLNALWILEKSIPAYYRENVPQEIHDLKQEIYSRMATGSFYATDIGCELLTDPNIHLSMRHTIRGDAIVKDTRHLNINGYKPNVVDIGPGEFFLPKLLLSENIVFSYWPVYMNHPTYQHYLKDFEHKLSKVENDRPTIFFACEIIEHLHEEKELRYEMNRNCNGLADIIHVSTPRETWDTNCLDWKAKGALGHLRTFSLSEFYFTVQSIFPEYDLNLWSNDIMHIRGTLKNTKFDLIKNTKLDDIFK